MIHPAFPGFEVCEARAEIENDETKARTLTTGIELVLYEAGIALPQYLECRGGHVLPDDIMERLTSGIRDFAAEWYTRGAHDEHEGMIIFRAH
jgi:hypothetical protein